ncbi:uncharacterized protein LOC126265969 [Aethina tumida]|uniref:uncharacterized protein LOC126265969 n=1 Tax=Aethina tumida TaxID=116153 RepID=UPI0021471D0C|nr:uncharacterized protein LOC126265969 [Aethina tumida]
MSSNPIFDIYRKPTFDETIKKYEVHTYYPYVKSFNNNDSIEITINKSDSWLLMHEAAIVIAGTLEKTAGDGAVQLVNNAGAFLFDRITYSINGHEVDSVRDPGIVSTIRGYLCYDSIESKHLCIAGWNFPAAPIVNTSDGSFVMRIPLHHLLGVFNDYQLAQFGRQTIHLVRARSDNDCFITIDESGATTETVGKLTIKDVSLKVPILFPNDVLKLNLLEAIKSDRPIIIPFRKWNFNELPQLTANGRKEIWTVKTCTALESPRYIIVAFQTGRRGVSKKDPGYFDNIDLSDVRITLNGDYYPVERMQLDFSKNHFTEAHYNYTEFKNNFKNDHSLPKHPLLDYVSFKNHAIFVIDCSRRNEPLKSSTVDVKIDIEANSDFPHSTKAYCIIIHDCIVEHMPLSEIVRNLS